MDDATLDRYAEAAWDLRCQMMTAAKERPPATFPWAQREPFLQDIDRAVASLVTGRAAADERARLSAELKEHMTGFFAHHGNSSGWAMQTARDLAEGIRQILDREPQ